ncbi:MAG: MBL fold metallo-hydrolase [Geminicoccaceae bacterium]
MATTRRTTRPRRRPAAAAALTPGSVAIRMYRMGFGDCFLLRFPGEDRERCVLVDCGTLSKTPDEVNEVVADLVATLPRVGGKPHLDVLALTHEHWDHLAGFGYAKAQFEALAVGEVWLAWTEDPADETARAIDKARSLALAAAGRIHARLQASGRGSRDAAGRLRRALAFFDPPQSVAADATPGLAEAPAAFRHDDSLGFGLPAGSIRRATRPIREFVRTHWGEAVVRYLEPGGARLALPGVAGTGAFVLGPPRDLAKLRRSTPRTRNPETYGLAIGLGAASGDGHAAALERSLGLGLDGAGERAFTDELPFDLRHPLRLATQEAEAAPWFREHYFGVDPERQIEDDWLGGAEELALKLDSNTNNTSLVLAFELGTGGKVLLFPGDAQVGNWLSWHDQGWTGADGATVTAKALLGRTVFYKVGHHGSHNATMREAGLELMTDPELVAAVPVDERYATEKQDWHDIPFDPLMAALLEKTRGRILRADRSLEELRQAPPPKGLDAAAWQAFCQDRVRSDNDRLWVEYVIGG